MRCLSYDFPHLPEFSIVAFIRFLAYFFTVPGYRHESSTFTAASLRPSHSQTASPIASPRLLIVFDESNCLVIGRFMMNSRPHDHVHRIA
jgi:hypothetical protein